eukprot:m.43431 g.43431  ORF g.43431 m.43431 type:complete len:84 (+) comp12216_c0_seq1:27-278(+)
MASLADRLVGLLMLLAAIAIFVLYTTWVVVTPFLPESHPLQQLFPARWLAAAVPAAAGGLVLVALAAFVLKTLLKSPPKPKAQ